VEQQLAAKGIHKAAAGQKPDVFVAYHLQTQESPDSQTTLDGFAVGEEWGLSDCSDGCWGDDKNARTSPLPRYMAILTVDIADARTNKLVWRAQAVVDSVAATQEGDEKQVERAVQRMFKKYPPK
jgi:hypothetical protein